MAELSEKSQLEQEMTGMDILTRISQIASSTLELREILDTITHVIAEKLNKDICYICLIKPEKKVICIEAAKGISKESINVFCMKDENDIISKVFHDLQPLAVEDTRKKEPHAITMLTSAAQELRSLLAVPILKDSTPIGILMVQTKEPHIYSQAEISLLTIISHNISAALQNAELYRNVKTQLDELKVIHEISKAITSILSIDDLLPHICEEVSKVFNVRGCVLRLLEGENLQIRAFYDSSNMVKHKTALRIGEGIAGHVARTGKPLMVDDTSRIPDDLNVRETGSTSAVCVPLRIGEKIIGTLSLYDKQDEWGATTFTQEDLST
ncbi:MAG: GAF domain-containing protein, partial [Nitrospirota bacterium]|nr:GAF domain-containing protein [Nitrospirota bacterium]